MGKKQIFFEKLYEAQKNYESIDTKWFMRVPIFYNPDREPLTVDETIWIISHAERVMKQETADWYNKNYLQPWQEQISAGDSSNMIIQGGLLDRMRAYLRVQGSDPNTGNGLYLTNAEYDAYIIERHRRYNENLKNFSTQWEEAVKVATLAAVVVGGVQGLAALSAPAAGGALAGQTGLLSGASATSPIAGVTLTEAGGSAVAATVVDQILNQGKKQVDNLLNAEINKQIDNLIGDKTPQVQTVAQPVKSVSKPIDNESWDPWIMGAAAFVAVGLLGVII